MEPLTFPLTQRLVTWKSCPVFRMSRNGPNSQILHLSAGPQSSGAVSRDLTRAVVRAEASLGWEVTGTPSLSTGGCCCLGFVAIKDQGQRVQLGLLAGLPLRGSQGSHGGYPTHTWHTEVTVPFQIVPVPRKGRELLQGQCQLCPCALRTETSAPLIISASTSSAVNNRLFQQHGVLCKFWSVQTELGEWHGNWAGFCW